MPPPIHRSASAGEWRQRFAHRPTGLPALPHSQGHVEGHVNRMKLLKRQSYGRAILDLLRRRLLYSVT